MSIPPIISPESIQAWAKDLPYTNKALVGREAFEILRGLPGQPLTGNNRLTILTSLEYPINLILEHLQAQIIGEHPKAPLFLNLGQEFCHLLDSNYEQLHRDLLQSRNTFGRDRTVQRLLRRQAECLEQQLLFQYLDHQTTNPNIWNKLHTLHLSSRIKDRNPYYRAIALHLGAAYRLSPRTIRDTFRALKRLPVTDLIDLGVPATTSGQIDFFLPGDGSPPKYGPIPLEARPLDLSRLIQALDADQGLDAETRNALQINWSAAKRTKELRVAPEKPLATLARFGLSDILDYLAGLDIPVTDEKGLQLRKPGELPRSDFHSQQEMTEVRIFDISDHGCRIRTGANDFRSGEIVCIHWRGQEKRIGSVVWFHKDAGTRECGIQWLLDQPTAVQIRFDSPTTTHALTGTSPDTGREILLYGSRHGRNHESCWIKSEQEWRRFSLIIIQKKGLIEIAETFLMQASPLPVQEPEATGTATPTPAPSPFQDVWEALSPFAGADDRNER
jgi:hypothetical protein